MLEASSIMAALTIPAKLYRMINIPKKYAVALIQ